MTQTATALLTVSGLGYAYGQRQAVADVSFEARRGEVLGFLGPNGAGKTTLLSCIAGLRDGYTGSMSMGGVPFAPAAHADQRARLGLVPQDLALYGELSGRENLRFFGRTQGLTASSLDAAIERALALSGLEDRADDRVKTYSGGMKRRLNLAIGDLHQPDLLLLDEPTVGVDPQSRNHIFESLQTLAAEGRTMFYTTHYMEEAERLCERVAVIHEGQLLALGTPAELAEQAGTPGANLEHVFLALTGRRLRD